MFSEMCGMKMCMCVCETVCRSVGEKKRVSMTSLHLSWEPDRLPATAFKVSLCVLGAIITEASQTRTMNPCLSQTVCLASLLNVHFSIYMHTSPTWVTAGEKRHAWRLRSSRRQTTVVTAVTHFLRSTDHLSVCSSNLIHVSSLLTGPQLPRHMCTRQCSLSAFSHSWHRDNEHWLQVFNSVSPENVIFFTYAQPHVCTAEPAVLFCHF